MDVPLRLLDLRCLVFIPTQHTVTLHASDSMCPVPHPIARSQPAGCVLCCEAKKDLYLHTIHSVRECVKIKVQLRKKNNFAARLGKSRYEREAGGGGYQEPEPVKNVMVTNNGKNAQGSSSVTMGTAEMAHCTPHTLAKVVHNNYRNCQTTLLSYSQKGSAWSLHVRDKTRQDHCTTSTYTAQLLRYSMAEYKARAEHSTASKASSNKNTHKILLMNKKHQTHQQLNRQINEANNY